nr:ATP-binding cassette domain-containing protein [Faecalibaculum rodentium]
MGPSGSGKSTLLYNTAGLDQADAGEVRLQDTVLTALSEDDKARLRLEKMGFVFQQMNTIPCLSLEENIVLPGIQAQGKRQKAKVKEKSPPSHERTGARGSGKQAGAAGVGRTAPAGLHLPESDQRSCGSLCG